MKKIIPILILVLMSFTLVSAETELIRAEWQNLDNSMTIRNDETASFYYRIASFDAPVEVLLILRDSNNQFVSNIHTETISQQTFASQGYTYTSSAIVLSPNDYQKPGNYKIVINVEDRTGFKEINKQILTLKVDQASENIAPIAVIDVSPSLEVNVNTQVTLSGTSSYDTDGYIAEYHWNQLSGQETFSFNEEASSFIVTPTKEGVYQFTLIVTDNEGVDSEFETKSIKVVGVDTPVEVCNGKDDDNDGQIDEGDVCGSTQSENIAPVASFTAPEQTYVGQEVTFDASPSTDEDGEITQYKWETEETTFFGKIVNYIYTKVGRFTIKLTVTDNIGATSTIEKIINVFSTPAENLAPVANAGIDQTVAKGTAVTLDSSASYDPEGTQISYLWDQIEGEDVNLIDDEANPTFLADKTGVFKFSLVVFDSQGLQSNPDTVTITVTEEIIPPIDGKATDIHKFTISSAFVQEQDNILIVYAKVRNRGNNRENVILTATLLPTGETFSKKTQIELKENSYEVFYLNKPENTENAVIKLEVNNRRDSDVYYLPLEV